MINAILAGTLLFGIGGAYAPNVPTKYITGNEQFHISLEYVVKISDRVSLNTGWHHYSNGARQGIGRHPNRGLDFAGTQLIFRLK